jgi:hypothetical protein
LKGGEHASFQRINQICEALETTLLELLQEQDSQRLETVSFPQEVQEFFVANMEAFFFSGNWFMNANP